MSRINPAFIIAITIMTTLSAIVLKLTVAPIIDMMAVSVFAALGAFLTLLSLSRETRKLDSQI
jgi:hypothetical protein